ncbi:SDR family oxidoreductase [Acidibrevibacterium fodinaquatile]|uniref:SDR family oxidoreductase n=1 Tax=Acidibrevibacterium fodinaquatile TaxID=1969806 RepID=UPI000E0DBA89|nr:SDR family oxidoreductase [Acidibrevibacterium fodinaquatile]
MSGKDRVALVTGAGSGVGRASARALAEAGFVVALAGRRRAALEETKALLPPGRGLVIEADVADPASVSALFATIGRECGRLDLLFNNAGINAPGVLLEDLAYEDWAKVVAINLTGAFLCAQAAFRMMKAQSPQGGRIINNGSISAHAPRPNSVAYTSTKHAITGLTKSLSLDGRKYDIACGQIDIGNAETEMAARMKHGVIQADGRIAAEPLMDVENVARSVAFMASLSLDANIQFVTVMATKMPFLGRG